jgi:hypothetical protein
LIHETEGFLAGAHRGIFEDFHGVTCRACVAWLVGDCQ